MYDALMFVVDILLITYLELTHNLNTIPHTLMHSLTIILALTITPKVANPVTAMPMIDESIPNHPHQKVSHIKNHPYLPLVTFMELTTTTPATTTTTTHQVDHPSITARMVLVEHQVLHHQDTLVEK